MFRVMFGPRGYQDFATYREARSFAAEKRRLRIAAAWGVAIVRL